jgi:methylmalonyl-CoA/ethylmalonyl-CoA epimerase
VITGVNHLAIAVPSLQEAIPFYRDVLGLPFTGTEDVPEQKVRVAFFQVGSTRLELLEPTAPDSPISNFLARRGPGLHHLALETDALEQDLERLEGQGVRLIDRQPRPGAHHTRIAFVHPQATRGVLLELTQPGE